MNWAAFPPRTPHRAAQRPVGTFRVNHYGFVLDIFRKPLPTPHGEGVWRSPIPSRFTIQ